MRGRCEDGSMAGPLVPCSVDNAEAASRDPILPESLSDRSSRAPTFGSITTSTQSVSEHLPTGTNGDVEHSHATVFRHIIPPSPSLPTTASHNQSPTRPGSSDKDDVMHGSPGAEATVPVEQEKVTVRKARTAVDDCNHPTTEPPGGSASRASSLNATHTRARTCSRDDDRTVNSRNLKRDRPAVAVVIPVKRQSARLKASVGRGRLGALNGSPREEDEENGGRNEDSDFADGDLPSADCSEWDARNPPRKRRSSNSPPKAATRASGSKEEGTVYGTCQGSVHPASAPDTAAGTNETREIFGRAILRIQPHGAQNAYFFTFLPEVTHPRATESPSPAPERASHSRGPRARWTRADDKLLVALKEARRSWHEIEREIPQRSSVSLKQRWSALKARCAPSPSRSTTRMRKQKRTF